ncbi:hypothetical protein FVW20_00310 [Desulfovibrio oxamicus]|uniref:Uncharacterized protein n=1 Tax=Nitratidesulfovibrio oxamicus TaxID=32016 RepID=A0ABS0IZ80_9BACT|nr:hypothetical protein [Nitratidesulfovibrio oxamicus]MBG3875507.1 hypothetical protein [Nitratidesulfovibrio oxamicus]
MAAKKVRVRLLGELWDRDAKGVRVVHKPGSVVSVPAELAERLITGKSAELYTDPSATKVAEVGDGPDEASPQAALAARMADKSKPAAPAAPAPQPETAKDDGKTGAEQGTGQAGTTGQG